MNDPVGGQGTNETALGGRYAGFSRRLGQMLASFLEEPIGIAVPLIALILFLSAPQMPDMFAGLKIEPRPGGSLLAYLRPFYLGLSAALLGFLAWYWTRAALMAYVQMDDAERQARRHGQHGPLSPAEWSRIWTPRLALLLAGGIAASPIIVAFTTPGQSLAQVPFAASLIGVGFVVLAFLITRYRLALGLAGGVPALPLMWRLRGTSILAAAPFGWPVALLLLGVSIAGSWVIAVHPAWIETYFDAPSAGLVALGLVIGPLVIALALLRDVIGWVLWLPFRLAQRFVGRSPDDRGAPGHATADVLGLALLLVLLYLPSLVNPVLRWTPRGFYQVRTLDTSLTDGYSCGPWTREQAAPESPAKTSLSRPTLEQALNAFRQGRLKAGYPADKPMPAIIVAAEGGASRAAVWLLSSMRQLDSQTQGAFGRQLFGISGVSGGSLGAVTYMQALRVYGAPGGGLDWSNPAVVHGLEKLADADLLGASIATYFMNDTMGRLFGPYWHAPDRSVALEHSFERQWRAETGLALSQEQAEGGLIALREGQPFLPHLFLNGTDADSGRRVITSTLRFDQRDDLFADSDDFLAILGRDVPASVAVTNSARFPLISPAGRFTDKCKGPRQLLDGGYFENYGARTASELAFKITQLTKTVPDLALLTPLVVVISDDADAYRTWQEARDNHGPTLWREAISCRSFTPGWRRRIRPSEEGTSPAAAAPAAETAEAAAADSAAAEEAADADFGIEGVTPLLGLFAAHGAYGRDALNILRRQLCPAPASPGLARMFHIALPKPINGKEAAPLNWVLNEPAKHYLLGETGVFDISFNQRQARRLGQTLEALRTGKSAPGS